MYDFFWNLADSIENFFKTPTAAAIGTVFIIVTVVLVLVLQRYYENN